MLISASFAETGQAPPFSVKEMWRSLPWEHAATSERAEGSCAARRIRNENERSDKTKSGAAASLPASVTCSEPPWPRCPERAAAGPAGRALPSTSHGRIGGWHERRPLACCPRASSAGPHDAPAASPSRWAWRRWGWALAVQGSVRRAVAAAWTRVRSVSARRAPAYAGRRRQRLTPEPALRQRA